MARCVEDTDESTEWLSSPEIAQFCRPRTVDEILRFYAGDV
jgi:hypothetical protein